MTTKELATEILNIDNQISELVSHKNAYLGKNDTEAAAQVEELIRQLTIRQAVLGSSLAERVLNDLL